MIRTHDEDYQKNLRLAWAKFINYEDFDSSFIRPEILDSWKRSRTAEVNPHDAGQILLDSESLNIKINLSLELLEIVRPYMDQLFSIVKDSGFFIIFCNKDGFILDLIGDREIVEYGRAHTSLAVGANRLEHIAGTNAIGTSLALKRPLQIWGEEHYIEQYKDYACSSAPFFDPDGNILGCIAITGRACAVHPHTLGMAISTAGSITKELTIKQAYKVLELISAQRNSIIEALPFGLILLNTYGRVIQINTVALKMFSLKYEQIIGKNLFDFIILKHCTDREEQMSLLQEESYDKEVSISLSDTSPQIMKSNMSINFTKDSSGRINGTILCFRKSKTEGLPVHANSSSDFDYDFRLVNSNLDSSPQPGDSKNATVICDSRDFVSHTPASKDSQDKELILDSLQKSSGNVTEAAKLLGISRRTFYRKLHKYHISSEPYRNR